MQLWLGRVCLILCVTAAGCPTGSEPPNTDEAQIRVNQGLDLRGKGDVDGAIAEFHTALRLDPNYVNAHMNLGVALATKGDWDGAIAEFRTAIRLDPTSTRAHQSLAIALRMQGMKAEAKDEFTTVLRLLPDTPANQKEIGRVKQQLRDLE